MRAASGRHLVSLLTAPLFFVSLHVQAAAPTADDLTSQSTEDPLSVCVATHRTARLALQAQNLIQVRTELQKCATEGCPIAIRAECGEWLAQAERQVPTLVLSASTEAGDVDTVKVTLDGAAIANRLDGHPIEAPPGPHVVQFELPDGRRQELRIVVGVGEKDRVVRAEFRKATQLASSTVTVTRVPVPPTAPPRTNRQRDLSYVLGLLSIGSAITAGSLLYVGLNERDEANRQCAPLCSTAEVNRVKRWLILADVSAIAATVTGGVGLYLFVTSDPKSSVPAASLLWRREF